MRLTLVRSVTTCSVILTLTAAALAHPGHGTTPAESISHQLVEPVHAIGLWSTLALAGAVWIRRWSRSSRKCRLR